MMLKKYFEFHNGTGLGSQGNIGVNNLPDHVEPTNPSPDSFQPDGQPGTPASGDLINFIKDKKYPALKFSKQVDGTTTTISFPMDNTTVDVISKENKEYVITYDGDTIDMDQDTARRIFLMVSTPDLI